MENQSSHQRRRVDRMAKVVNIEDKLSFNENPKLRFGEDLEVEVNADAETVLKLMGCFSDGSSMEKVDEALHLVFNAEDVEKIASMKKDGKKLSASSLMTIVSEAMSLIIGENEGE